MSDFFNDTMTGLLEAVAIDRGEIPLFNLGIRENEFKHRRWNEEMKKKCGKDYLDKVWTEEWQRENLSLKDYYSGVEITNPEKKDDTIRWV